MIVMGPARLTPALAGKMALKRSFIHSFSENGRGLINNSRWFADNGDCTLQTLRGRERGGGDRAQRVSKTRKEAVQDREITDLSTM